MSVATNFNTIMLLEGFNNYFNRIIKKLDSIEDYEDYQDDRSQDYFYLENINFNPNDNVSTKLIVNDASAYGCDYLLVIRPTDDVILSRWFIINAVRLRNGQYELSLKKDNIADNLNKLLTIPMFVQKGMLEDTDPFIFNDEGMSFNQVKTSETLLKDKTKSSWIVGYVAKNAIVSDTSVQIPDTSIDFYETIENIASETGVEAGVLADALASQDTPNSFITGNIDIVGWINYPENTNTETKIVGTSYDQLGSFGGGLCANATHTPLTDCFARRQWRGDAEPLNQSSIVTIWRQAINQYLSSIKTNWENYTNNKYLNRSCYDRLIDLSNNNTPILKNGKYYYVRLRNQSVQRFETSMPRNTTPFSLVISKFLTDWATYQSTHPQYDTLTDLNQGVIYLAYQETLADFYLEEMSDFSTIPGITINMSSTRNVLSSQPFDMFAIPYDDLWIKYDNSNTISAKGTYAKEIAMAMMGKYTDAKIYDIQLLPYCPVPEIVKNSGIDVSSLTEKYDYDVITVTNSEVREESEGYCQAYEYIPGQYEGQYFVRTGIPLADVIDSGYSILQGGHLVHSESYRAVEVLGEAQLEFTCQIDNPQDADEIEILIWWTHISSDPVNCGIVLYPKKNSFSIKLNYNLSTNKSIKVDALCDKYRLVSPNYQGSFDFCVAKNGGKVEGFIADMTYRPYNPYIKVSPNFNYLYGTNFGDCRGLICGGDYSIGFFTDRWETYQLNNKNYQNIFNRDIQSLDLQQEIQRRNQVIGSVAGVFGDTIKGGVTGGIASGSVYGAIAGAAVGGALSTTGAIIDYQTLGREQRDQRSLAIDKYNYQLGNIKALPYTLTKVGAFDINSKIFPFLEYYTATEQEIEALENKIKYESMTVMRIDYLENFITLEGEKRYFKAEMIRNEEIEFSTEVYNSIYGEFVKGVYI